jgi:hypothetical protein
MASNAFRLPASLSLHTLLPVVSGRIAGSWQATADPTARGCTPLLTKHRLAGSPDQVASLHSGAGIPITGIPNVRYSLTVRRNVEQTTRELGKGSGGMHVTITHYRLCWCRRGS